MTHKSRKSYLSFFEVLDVLFLRLKASPVAWTGHPFRRSILGISKLQFFVIKILNLNPSSIDIWIRIRIRIWIYNTILGMFLNPQQDP